jgi:lysophospholipid hydrolase
MALEEEGIPVDMLGGTSMGSFVGGIYAKEPTALLTRIIARRLAVHMSSAWNQLADLTLPLVSYFSGFGMNKVLEPLFRGAKIEDCWLPFFCMTLDLISCAPIVHRNGTLWRYVRASMALVGFLPPLCDRLPPRQAAAAAAVAAARAGVPLGDGGRSPPALHAAPSDPGRLHVLVDGGYVNNMPTDVMRAMGARFIVAVDVSGNGLPEARMKPWGDGVSGLSILFQQWLPSWLGGGPTCPTMAAMQVNPKP